MDERWDQLRRGEPSPAPERPVAAPAVTSLGWPELDRLAAATDHLIDTIDGLVTDMERRYGL